MNIKLFIDKFANLKAENKLLKFAIVVVTAGCVFSSYYSYQAVTHQKIVILPPVVDKRIVIAGNDVNDAYLKLFSKYTLNLLFNYTPETFRDQASDLLKLATPEFYNTLEQKLSDMAEGIESLQITSTFFPQTLKVDRDKMEISVSGLRVQTAQGQEIENKIKKYIIEYKIIDGRFFLNGINESVA